MPADACYELAEQDKLLTKSGARVQRRAWIWRYVPTASVWRLKIHASAEVNSEFDHVRYTP